MNSATTGNDRSMLGPAHLERGPGGDDPVMIGSDDRFVLPCLIEEWYRNDKDRLFLTEVETGRTETYGSFRDLTRRWATILLDRGVSPGERVVSLLPSSIDAHAVWVAAGLVGAVEVPINPDLRGSFLDHALTLADPTVCIVRSEHKSTLENSGAGELNVLGFASGTCPADTAPVADISRLPTPTETSCVIYTSGTSGPAKGVVLSWAQMATAIGRIPRSWLSGDDRAYSPWPMFHVTGRSPLMMMADVGGQVITRERFSLRHFWNEIDRYACTVTTAGAVAGMLLAEPVDPADRRHRLRHVFLGSGPTGLKFVERFDVNGIACYGSTEAGFPIANPSMNSDNFGSIGRLRPGYEARLVDREGKDVEPGDVGELWLRPQSRSLIFSRYLDDPDRTAAAVVDGWYHTGDAVRRSDDGSFYFVDRIRDTIRRFGENISSKQVELAVLADGDVVECAVVGVASETSGQEVALFVVATPGSQIDPAQLSKRLTEILPGHMQPTYIAVRSDLPKTPNGKVRKQSLVDEIDLEQMWRRRPENGRRHSTTA